MPVVKEIGCVYVRMVECSEQLRALVHSVIINTVRVELHDDKRICETDNS